MEYGIGGSSHSRDRRLIGRFCPTNAGGSQARAACTYLTVGIRRCPRWAVRCPPLLAQGESAAHPRARKKLGGLRNGSRGSNELPSRADGSDAPTGPPHRPNAKVATACRDAWRYGRRPFTRCRCTGAALQQPRRGAEAPICRVSSDAAQLRWHGSLIARQI